MTPRERAIRRFMEAQRKAPPKGRVPGDARSRRSGLIPAGSQTHKVPKAPHSPAPADAALHADVGKQEELRRGTSPPARASGGPASDQARLDAMREAEGQMREAESHAPIDRRPPSSGMPVRPAPSMPKNFEGQQRPMTPLFQKQRAEQPGAKPLPRRPPGNPRPPKFPMDLWTYSHGPKGRPMKGTTGSGQAGVGLGGQRPTQRPPRRPPRRGKLQPWPRGYDNGHDSEKYWS